MPRSTPQAILLVDGYNIIGAWPWLKEVGDRDGLEEARRQLIECLLSYSSVQNFETEVVFDAHYQDLPGSREGLTSYLSVCYTDFRQSADSYIEIACARFRNDARKFNRRLIVATSDRVQRQTVVGYGAEWFSAQRLLAEVEAAEQRVQSKQRQKQKQKGRSPSRFLASSLDPEAQERLSRLRFGKPD